ncbi:hypothetical protein D0Y65_048797 [Glycine soja]|uniref:Protein TAPETUM DETERMINANT 1 n=1 Tax=Glycine soja TaxID=3848 RepID=A0A445FUG6_GLYSO|nr:hypothetical protein D0Y65_048797 [Glycine soja]
MTNNIFSIVLFLVLISQGNPEWSVTITNKCPCIQKNVILNCTGFQSVERVNPSLLRVSRGGCLINAGQPIYGDAIKFKYAWNQQFPMKPISSDIFCS